jgi:hypothetical protein
MVASTILATVSTFLLTGCSSSESAQPTTAASTTSSGLVPGYTGGCKEGITLYVQNQFTPYGTLIRRDLAVKSDGTSLRGNEVVKAVGWTKTDLLPYPPNPLGIQGAEWYYVPNLPNGMGPGWIPDAGVRDIPTQPAENNSDSAYHPDTQGPSKAPACELRH